jgi:riboflavin biosynthesis pyrimidine reductase
MRRLFPQPDEVTVDEQLRSYMPWEQAHGDRPFVAVNFVATVDGRASVDGRSGTIGSEADTAMLVGLRKRFDAVMIGHGTKRVEGYEKLERPLVVVESGPDGPADLVALLRDQREQGVRALLCEGGPRLHASLQALGLVDELFLTIAPRLAGAGAPGILEGELPGVAELELVWLLEQDGELFARYRVRAAR